MTDRAYIPIINTPAGACLTAANWQELGISTVACSLALLLMKPGLEVLQQVQDLKAYLAWSGSLILDGRSLSANKEGVCILRSPFDGSTVKWSTQELIELIKHLQPDAALLSEPMQEQAPELACDELATAISDAPAQDALNAWVYKRSGNCSLMHEAVDQEFEPLCVHCTCPTCNQKLSIAYLRHLFIQTPLLCQRFLIQHNAYCAFTL